MKKKAGVFILLLSLALSFSAKAGFYAPCSTGQVLYYEILSPQEVAVSYGAASCTITGALVIPSVVEHEGVNYSVTSIGAGAFELCNNLISITIPNTVTSIGNLVFYGCSGLVSITVEAGNPIYDSRNMCNAIIRTADNTLIAGCKNTTIPYSVTSIGDYAFEDCSGLTSITIPNSVTSIDRQAFYGCIGLTSITIPNSVTSIGDAAFYGCSGLTSITIPNSVTHIGHGAFNYCSGLTSITVEAGNPIYDSRDMCNAIIWTSADVLIAGCKNTTIPYSISTIDGDAFSGCSGLTSITIPYFVTSMGPLFPFNDCSGLASITVEAGNPIYDSRDMCNAIIRTSDNTLFLGCKNTIIPNSITAIGFYAFSGCGDLSSITIPNSVTSIGNSAFAGCSDLNSITIPSSITSIGSSAFAGCSGLTSITIPNSVTSIGDMAFESCSGLASITVEAGNPIYDSRDMCNAIIRTADNTLLAGCKNTTIPNSVTSIGIGAFLGCSGLTSITIPNSVASIGDAAFYGCSGLTSITIPNSVTSIASAAFMSCSGLTSITIPNSVTSIGYGAFFDCSGLSSVIFESANPPVFEALGFPWCNDNFVLYVPVGSAQNYETALDSILGIGNGVRVVESNVGIIDHNINDALTVYPNPTSDVVNVQLSISNEQLDKVDIHLVDAYGRLLDVVETPCMASPETTQINLSRYAKGVYFVKAVADGKTIAVRKVVKR